ncbi:hypothetical protein LZP85_09060 [Priestia flexa]|jgi:hypothetical protein|uniref:hypothetical protein n=1 Tax=Priestia flexa TaxID=86664 RepID=UPI001F1D64A9|nr:hypothetical protein [Priestia flexa]UIR31894.1 hypothetical protein LZP85_09060 [Priestia flexa]UZW65380.1 hypothetical protein OC195_14615 [Priestia flexa]
MRFLIEYKDFKTKQTSNSTLEVLETLLNEHLIGTFHGDAFECIYTHFVSNIPSTKKTLKLRLLYGSMAEMEIVQQFKNDQKLNLEDFTASLLTVEKAIRKAEEINVKEESYYDKETLLSQYEQLKIHAPSSQEELNKYKASLAFTKKSNYAKRIDCMLKQDQLTKRPLNKLIEGFTVNDPYDLFNNLSYRYSELFSNLLLSAGVYLPSYSQIHIHIAGSLLEAKQELALEPWYKMTYGSVDLACFNEATDTKKEEMLLQSISEGLLLLTEVDHLDRDKIKSVISQVEKNGLNQELTYFQRENKRYKAEVVYHIPKDHVTKTAFYLRVTDLQTNQVAETFIDNLLTFYAGASLYKLAIKKDEIVISGRSGYRAELMRKSDKLPEKYCFSLKELFSQKV